MKIDDIVIVVPEHDMYLEKDDYYAMHRYKGLGYTVKRENVFQMSIMSKDEYYKKFQSNLIKLDDLRERKSVKDCYYEEEE